jgi:hypothetical protein
MIRSGNWTLSSEIIYDEYGMYHDFDPNDIFWKKSIYYRQINKREHAPIHGVGGYVDLSYNGSSYIVGVNYGEYHPEQLRKPNYPQHDYVNRRFIIKFGWNFTNNLQWYNAYIRETDGFIAQEGRIREGNTLVSGVKMEF